ncbi:hypothetical protein D3C74_241650 [compost metagenome]
MENCIKIRVIDAFTEYNHDKSIVLSEVDEGELLLAELHPDSEEYFAKDKKGREVYIGRLNPTGGLELDEGFELITKQMSKDYLFSALAYMGNASGQISWANNCLEDAEGVPTELKIAIKGLNSAIHGFQEQLRGIRDNIEV